MLHLLYSACFWDQYTEILWYGVKELIYILMTLTLERVIMLYEDVWLISFYGRPM